MMNNEKNCCQMLETVRCLLDTHIQGASDEVFELNIVNAVLHKQNGNQTDSLRRLSSAFARLKQLEPSWPSHKVICEAENRFAQLSQEINIMVHDVSSQFNGFPIDLLTDVAIKHTHSMELNLSGFQAA